MALLPSAGASDPSSNNGLITGKPAGIADTLLNLVDPSGIRKQLAGLKEGGLASLFLRGSKPKVNINTPTDKNNPLLGDWRVRVSLPKASNLFYKDKNNSFLSVLTRTNGVVFPYTPAVSITHNARYQEQSLTHSNYKNYFYEGSDVSAIQISGDFTVQNHDDAIYLLAVIWFLRSSTKMFFGNDALAGNPPPIVYLDGYGDYYFPHVSCVITSFQHTMPAEVDYVEFKYSQNQQSNRNNGSIASTTQQVARLPTTSQITVTLQPVYSRSNVYNNMTLGQFSQGRLLSGKGGFL